jgi:NADH:ubiquinone oxidoreductase subunit E
MRDLSLHILDIAENSIRADASVISVSVEASVDRDRLIIGVEDNGAGLTVPPGVAADPFYTSKKGKKVGLGLSLLSGAAERASGFLEIGTSDLGGVSVRVSMRLSHPDRSPLGDLAATLSSLVCTNPGLDLRCRFQMGDKEVVLHSSEIARGIPTADCCGLSIARKLHDRIQAVLSALNLNEEFIGELTKEKTMADEKPRCACGEEVSEAELLSRLDQVLEEYKAKPGALIPVLQIAQGMFGYLPESALRRISTALNKSYSEVAGTVGFYSFFSTNPRGKNVIRVCLGTACYVRGGKRVLEAIQERLGIDVGQTTPDRLFTLEVARCFGACGLAPTISINDEVYKRVRPTKVNEILNAYHEKEPATK